jgi:hypothetical protein
MFTGQQELLILNSTPTKKGKTTDLYGFFIISVLLLAISLELKHEK